MIFHILVKIHLGDAPTWHVCTECARKLSYPPLREPPTYSPDGTILVGAVRTYESDTARCQECGASNAAIGYLRCCAHCKRSYLLDHAWFVWPPPAWFCPRPGCRKAEAAYR